MMADAHELDILQALPRFLFLEETIAGRRVLEVGARNTKLAAFLLELGAKRVVCAVHDESMVAQLREDAPRGVDVRLVREGVLPGDDGAFDLVVDFALPVDLATHGAWRAQEIDRLLSDDGFALTVVTGAPEVTTQAVLPVPVGGPAMGYRQVAELLNDIFDVVEVYFQSLLVGYLIGSFDADASEDGVAPQTGLMGEDVEPASFYIFSFGPAVPLIEDISLIQIPVTALAPAALPPPQRVVDVALPPAASEQAAVVSAEKTEPMRAVPAADDDEVTLPMASVPLAAVALAAGPEDEERITQLTEALAQRDTALAALAERMPRLRQRVEHLVEGLRESEAQREDAVLHLEQIEVAMQTRDVYIDALRARASALELAERVARTKRSDHEDRESERETWFAAARAEIDELHASLAQLSSERDRLAGAATTAERRANEAHDALTMARDREQVFQRELARLENLAQRAQGEAQSRSASEKKNAALENELAEMRVRLEEVAQSSAQQLEESRIALAEEHARRRNREAELDKALHAAQQAERAQSTVLEERKRLADGVNRLIAERTVQKKELIGLRAQVDDIAKVEAARDAARIETSEVASALSALQSEQDKLHSAVSEAHQERDAALARVKKLMKSVEDKAVQVGLAQNTLTEISAQRDTLARVVQKRDKEVAELTTDVAAQRAENERLEGERVAFAQRDADAQAERDALKKEVENISRQKRGVEKAVRDAHHARDTAVAATLAAKKDLDEMNARLDDAERTRQKLLEELRGQQTKIETLLGDQEKANFELSAKERSVEDARHALGQEQRARERAVSELEGLHERVAELDARLSADAKTHDLERTRLESETSANEAQRRQLQTDTETLRSERDALLTRADALAADLEVALGKGQTQSATLDAATQQVQRLEATRAELAASLEAAKVEATRIQARLVEVQAQHEQDQSQHQDLDASVRRVRQERDGLRAELVQKERDQTTHKEALAARAKEIEAARLEVQRLSDDAAALKKKLGREVSAHAEAREERDALKRDLAARSAEARDADALLAEGQRASARVAEEQARAEASAQRAREALADAERRLLAVEKDREDTATRLAAALESERHAQAETVELSTVHKTDVQRLTRERDAMEAARDDVQTLLDRAQARIDGVTNEVKTVREEQAALHTALESKGEALIHREQAILALTEQLSSAEDELAEKSGGTAQLEGMVTSLKARVTSADTQDALLRAQLDEAQRTLGTERARGELYQAQLDELQTYATTLAAQDEMRADVLHEARVQLNHGAARVDLLAAGLAEAQDILDARATEGALWHGQLEEAQHELLVMNEKVQALRERLTAQKRDFAGTEETLGQELVAITTQLREERDRTEAWERRALEAEVTLDAERSELSASLDDVKRQVSDTLRAKEDEAAARADIDARLEDATTRVAALQTDRAALLAEVEALKQALEESLDGSAQALHEELRLQAADIAAKDEQVRQLRASLDDAKSDLDAAKAALIASQGVVTAEGPALEGEGAVRMAELERALVTLRQDLEEKNDRINRLTQRLISRDGL